MDITLDILRQRHSVRTFAGPCDAAQIKKLKAIVTDINTHGAGMHFQLITDSPEAFGSFSKSYGLFKGVSDYVACIVDTSYSYWLERAGYYGMQLVCQAVALGLGTCFVSGTFSHQAVNARIRVGEELVMLIALGQKPEHEKKTLMARITSAMAHRHKSLTPMDFLDTQLPWETICTAFPKIYDGLEAVSYAPSALNKQPVGIIVKKSDDTYNPVSSDKADKKTIHQQELSARYDELLHNAETNTSAKQDTNTPPYLLQAYVPAKNKSQLIDLGIAMYSFQAVYPGDWDWGNPATFTPL